MDDLRLAEIARRQGGVVTTAQLGECGLGRSGVRHRVAAGRLFRIRRRAYALSPHRDRRAELWAAVLSVDPERAAVSHWSAAEVHGMTVARASPIHVIVPGTGGRTGAGLHIHGARSVPAADTILVAGLRVTSPARTVLDIVAASTDPVAARLIREGEFLGLLPSGEIARVIASHPGHPGIARLRRTDPETVEAALRQTPIEDELDALVATLPLPFPQRQVPLRGVSGAPYRVDFGWPDIRLAVEADGRSAHERASSLESDRFRDNDLAAVGWLVLRFTRTQILQGRADAAAQIVATAMARRRPAAA